METLLQIQRRWLRTRHLPAVVISLALLLLGASIVASMLDFRARLRSDWVRHEGEGLYAAALMRQASLEELASPAVWSDPAEQFDLALNISRLKGVLGLRLYSPEGDFINAAPAPIIEAPLARAELALLWQLQPVSRFVPRQPLAELDLLSEGRAETIPLLVVNVPLHSAQDTKLVGVAQFLIQGESLNRAFTALDRGLAWQAGLYFLVGGSLLGGALWLAFRRLAQVNQALSERSASLLRANQQLVLAAKSSAVGAIAAHLIHGLKNPLSGLRQFVDHQADGGSGGERDEWNEAQASTRRMQGLVREIVRILGEEQIQAGYELTLSELIEIITANMASATAKSGARFLTRREGEGSLTNQQANLVTLILENLLANALDATPRDKSVLLTCRAGEPGFQFEVADEGPGLPEAAQTRLFTPCHSNKPEGSGLGLAISQQLARHLGGSLELLSTSSAGTVFRLTLPKTDAAPGSREKVAEVLL